MPNIFGWRICRTLVTSTRDECLALPVPKIDVSTRLDRWLRRMCPQLSNGLIQKEVRRRGIQVSSVARGLQCGHRLCENDVVHISPRLSSFFSAKHELEHTLGASEKETELVREAVGSIVLETPHFVVVNKRPGLPVHGGSRVGSHSVQAFLPKLLGTGGMPQLVHRLDKDTSGCLLLARSASIAAHLSRAFRDRQVRKTYVAAVTVSPSHPWYSAACVGESRRGSAGITSLPLQGTIRLGLVKRKLASEFELMCPAGVGFVSTRRVRSDGDGDGDGTTSGGGEPTDGGNNITKDIINDAVTHYEVLAFSSVTPTPITSGILRPALPALAWLLLRPESGRKHQLRAHCLFALHTPIVGDAKYTFKALDWWRAVGETNVGQYSSCSSAASGSSSIVASAEFAVSQAASLREYWQYRATGKVLPASLQESVVIPLLREETAPTRLRSGLSVPPALQRMFHYDSEVQVSPRVSCLTRPGCPVRKPASDCTRIPCQRQRQQQLSDGLHLHALTIEFPDPCQPAPSDAVVAVCAAAPLPAHMARLWCKPTVWEEAVTLQ